MRMSTALMLGSLLLKAKPFVVDNGTEGCAMGMILRAGGSWAAINKPVDFPIPCNCDRNSDIHLGKDAYGALIMAHLFNHHVMTPSKLFPNAEPWTLEHLATWLDTIDPEIHDNLDAIVGEHPEHTEQPQGAPRDLSTSNENSVDVPSSTNALATTCA